MCNSKCNKVCCHLTYSESVIVDGDNVVVALPEINYRDCNKFCLVITQAIPTTATVNQPVVITVGDNTILFPLVDCTGLQVTASMISTRCRYPVCRNTNGVSTVFKIQRNLSSKC